MSDARSKVLEMLANGKISVEESSRLLDALGSVNSESTTETVDDTVFEKFSPVKKKPKWLKIQIKELNGETMNIRVPLVLLKAGIKLGSILPESAKVKFEAAISENEQRINLFELGNNYEELVEALSDFRVDFEGKGSVRIYCE
jgi:hypothetical protein